MLALFKSFVTMLHVKYEPAKNSHGQVLKPDDLDTFRIQFDSSMAESSPEHHLDQYYCHIILL